ncbi:unnamed protein product [Macrosiphum euphorbiae]|uniref:CLIP domain-containing serine protease n=1 Tax=Macrosiphum euphorbiae TaxID=13131 RepID=A0AAV0W6A8_9HEMI|nr:unnamed protein product [Macrosiphum euphorbiae]
MDRVKFIICMVFVFSLGNCEDKTVKAQNLQENRKCFTPNGDNGNCINIKRCPTLLHLLEHQGHNSSIATFLIKSKCGDEDNFPYYPKVCCLDDVIFKLPSQDTCGRNNVSRNLIVGGRLAELGDWPWIAALGYQVLSEPMSEYKWLCGGSLISDRYVLTAAHCTIGSGMYRLSVVRLGDLNLDPNVVDGAEPIDVAISRVIIHTRYNSRTNTNDIALLKLGNSVGFNQFIQPICLPILSHHRAKSLTKLQLSFAGWGSTMLNRSSDALIEVELPVLSNSECKKIYESHKTNIDDTQLCAGIKGRDSCMGDSGGPLIWPKGSQYYLVGVMNFGHLSCGTDIPGVYARVTSFLEWIVENMN